MYHRELLNEHIAAISQRERPIVRKVARHPGVSKIRVPCLVGDGNNGAFIGFPRT